MNISKNDEKEMASAKQTFYASFKKPFNESSSFRSNTTIITQHTRTYIYNAITFITLISRECLTSLFIHYYYYTRIDNNLYDRITIVCERDILSCTLEMSPSFIFQKLANFSKGLKIKMFESHTKDRITVFKKSKSRKMLLDSRSKSQRSSK